MKSARIADFCTTGSGGTPPRAQMQRYYEGGTIPWVKSGELSESLITDTEEYITKSALQETSVKMVPAGALLLAMYGATVGRLGILGVPATTNQAICHILPNTDIAGTRYLFYVLRGRVEDLLAQRVGGAQPNINQGIIKDLVVPLPPLSEQQRIVEIFDRTEALRTKRRETAARLDELAGAIFLEMFGDPLAPTSRWPQSTFGEELDSLTYGPRFHNESYSQDGVRIVRITDLDDAGTLDFTEMPRLNVDEPDRKKYALREGDLLFARSGSVGKTAVYPAGAPESIAGAYFIVMRFKPSVTPLFVRSVLATASVRQFIQMRSRQAIQPNFSGPSIRVLPLPLPPIALQQEYARRIEILNKMKALQHESLLEMDTLFASLQNRAFRGEL